MSGGRSDSLRAKLSDAVLGQGAYTPLVTLYLALFTTTPKSDGSSGVEVSGSGYARLAVANTSANWSAWSAQQKTNAIKFTFPTATGDWGTVVAVGVMDAATNGTLHKWLELIVPGTEVPFTGDATTDKLTAPGNTFITGDTVRLGVLPGASLPGGLSERTTYYVLGGGATAFQVSATLGGAALDLTSVGAGRVGKLQPQICSNGTTLTFNAGQLVFSSV